MFPSSFVCPDCGVSLDQGERESHTCEHDRWLDHQVSLLREELDRFDADLTGYLASPRGRFEQWYAAHRRAGLGRA